MTRPRAREHQTVRYQANCEMPSCGNREAWWIADPIGTKTLVRALGREGILETPSLVCVCPCTPRRDDVGAEDPNDQT